MTRTTLGKLGSFGRPALAAFFPKAAVAKSSLLQEAGRRLDDVSSFVPSRIRFVAAKLYGLSRAA
eukprot:11885302-Heterocapsa_arctica.AAC.1